MTTDIRVGPPPRIRNGAEQTLVLVHAALLDRTMWTSFLAELDVVVTRPLRVVAPDIRGHGSSDGELPRDMSQLADDLATVLGDLGVPRAHLCGLSLGGAVVQALAVERPDVAASLVLVATDLRFPTDPLTARAAAVRDGRGTRGQLDETLARWFPAQLVDADDDGVRYARERILATTPELWSATWSSLAGFSVENRTARVQAPVLAVSGAQDSSTPPERLRAVAAAYPNGRHVTVDPGSHLLALHRPAELARLVADFLRT